eukprot:1333743-Amphidinium_carterae.1
MAAAQTGRFGCLRADSAGAPNERTPQAQKAGHPFIAVIPLSAATSRRAVQSYIYSSVICRFLNTTHTDEEATLCDFLHHGRRKHPPLGMPGLASAASHPHGIPDSTPFRPCNTPVNTLYYTTFLTIDY